jgi:hypothetical protein
VQLHIQMWVGHPVGQQLLIRSPLILQVEWLCQSGEGPKQARIYELEENLIVPDQKQTTKTVLKCPAVAQL